MTSGGGNSCGVNGDLTVAIYTSSAGAPGSAISGASGTIGSAGLVYVPTEFQVKLNTPPSLTSGARYFIVMQGANTSGCYEWTYDNNNSYGAANGSEYLSTDAGSTWTQDANGAGSGNTTRSMRFATIMGP